MALRAKDEVIIFSGNSNPTLAEEICRYLGTRLASVTTAVGVGCVLASGMSLAVIGRRWISPWILLSAVAIGMGLVAVSLVGSHVVASLLVLAVFGILLPR